MRWSPSAHHHKALVSQAPRHASPVCCGKSYSATSALSPNSSMPGTSTGARSNTPVSASVMKSSLFPSPPNATLVVWRHLIEDAFRSAGIDQAMTLEVGNSFVACAYVRAGPGVALVDSLAIDSGAFPDLVSIPVSSKLEISAVLVRRGLQRQSLLATAFEKELRASAQSIHSGAPRRR